MSAVAQFKTEKPITADDFRSPEAQSMEAIGRMVSGIAHDFNNLLTGIVLCSDLLLSGLDKDSRLRRYAQEIRSAANHGATMVQQLSALARPGASEPEPLSLNDVISDMQGLLGRLIGEHIAVITNLAASLGCVQMSLAQARQIILNLVLNARDAMPEGGQLRLITRNAIPTVPSNQKVLSTCIEFEVNDTGMGMDSQTRSRIFEPFFTTKSPGKGTGLGLATVLNIVQQHRGTIDIQSELRKGTKVIVSLPAHDFQTSKKGITV